MSKTNVNFWLDCLLLALFMALLWCSLVVRFVFPLGPLSLGWTVWGYDCGAWQNAQFILMALLTLGILVHVMLHWTWVCGGVASYRGRRGGQNGKKMPWDDGQRTLLGVGVLIVILHIIALALLAAWMTVQSPYAA